jgi:hypothetical protein
MYNYHHTGWLKFPRTGEAMAVTPKTRITLWGRSSGICAFPDCRKQLIKDATDEDDESLIGDAAHIVGEELKGPRGKDPLPLDKRNKYANLILLCKIHHKLVDDQENTYTIAALKKMKLEHEKWVQTSLPGYDTAKQRDHEIYAGYIDQWSQFADLDNWDAWTSWVLGGGQPQMKKTRDTRLEKLREWLFGRIWPQRYPLLEAAFKNFSKVLADFQNTFRSNAEERGDEMWTRKLYQIEQYDEELYNTLSDKYDFHVDLVMDLMVELTRSGNLVAQRIREVIDPLFRLKEGVLLVTVGPDSSLVYQKLRLEYLSTEIPADGLPYPGLKDFKVLRGSRSFHFGDSECP